MPEMTVTVRWPDGHVQYCYSPSLVMHDHLSADTVYRVDDFVGRARTALTAASERVRLKYGFACTSAMATLADIECRADGFTTEQTVQVLQMTPALPAVVR